MSTVRTGSIRQRKVLPLKPVAEDGSTVPLESVGASTKESRRHKLCLGVILVYPRHVDMTMYIAEERDLCAV